MVKVKEETSASPLPSGHFILTWNQLECICGLEIIIFMVFHLKGILQVSYEEIRGKKRIDEFNSKTIKL